jgi:hypothetical protein
MKKLEILKLFEENEENALLQTIHVPKNLNFLTNKLPQSNYEKDKEKDKEKEKEKKYSGKNKNNSFIDEKENKESLPGIKISGSQNNLGRKSEKKSDRDRDSIKDIDENKKEDQCTAPNLQINISKTEENNLKVYNDQDNNIQRKKRRFENNDRSLDNIKINGSSINNNNIVIIKSENYDKSINNSIIREKSPVEENSSIRKRKEFMYLPNIKYQKNIENK